MSTEFLTPYLEPQPIATHLEPQPTAEIAMILGAAQAELLAHAERADDGIAYYYPSKEGPFGLVDNHSLQTSIDDTMPLPASKAAFALLPQSRRGNLQPRFLRVSALTTSEYLRPDSMVPGGDLIPERTLLWRAFLNLSSEPFTFRYSTYDMNAFDTFRAPTAADLAEYSLRYNQVDGRQQLAIHGIEVCANRTAYACLPAESGQLIAGYDYLQTEREFFENLTKNLRP